jgi:RNA polymerase sigma factor (sigma-70 family)
MKVKRVCIAVRNAYQVPETYSIDDLYQDVMFRFWKALRRYRGEASLTTVIHRIAVNQLIDQGRKEGWCKNPSRSKTENRGGDTHVEEDFVTKPRRGHRETGQYDGAERELQTIFVHELQETWTDTDHFVWDRYLAGEKLADTAAILAITPQAVSNRRKRLINKTRKLVEAGTTTTALTQTRATA